MVKDKHYAAYAEWWKHWLSKVPNSRDGLEGSVPHVSSKAESRADRARFVQRLRRIGTPLESGRNTPRGGRSSLLNGDSQQDEIRTGGWED